MRLLMAMQLLMGLPVRGMVRLLMAISSLLMGLPVRGMVRLLMAKQLLMGLPVQW